MTGRISGANRSIDVPNLVMHFRYCAIQTDIIGVLVGSRIAALDAVGCNYNIRIVELSLLSLGRYIRFLHDQFSFLSRFLFINRKAGQMNLNQ
jgi:hypothetical protein